MDRLVWIKLLPISFGVLLLIGCGRSHEDAAADKHSEAGLTTPSISAASVTNQLKVPPQAQKSASILGLQVVSGDDPIYRFMASQMIGKKPTISAALAEQKGTLDDGRITSRDLGCITEELGKVEGFRVSDHGGTAVKFDRFLIGIIGGYVGEDYFNAYLIRIPGHGWTLLETRRVPEPLRTRSR